MYDPTLKVLVENFSDDIATWLVGKPVTLTELSPTELSLEPIRADSLILLQSDQIILHIEFQTGPDPAIAFRMLDYFTRIYRKFPHKQIRQTVIYLRPSNSELVRQDSFSQQNTNHHFQVIRLWEQPTQLFLELPGLIPFAILSQTDNPIQTLKEVAKLVESIADQKIQTNIMLATFILSGLILDKAVIQQILRRDAMKESVTYQAILEEGLAEGLSKGRSEGRSEGLEEGKLIGKLEGIRLVAKNLLKIGMPPEQVSLATELTIDEIANLAN